MRFQPRRAIATASDSDSGRARAAALARAGMDIGASWPVDGGMLQMGPRAGSDTAADDWRTG